MTPSDPSAATPSTAPIVASVRIAAPPGVVFGYFTDRALITRWLAEEATLDARPGGGLALDVAGNPVRGEFVEVDAPHRVVFTWGVEGEAGMPPGSTTVEVVLAADGEDTVVTLTHRGLAGDFRRSHEEGWNQRLGALAPVAAKR
jgi:uncharacterized protein YndB with AHSA1/START domain